MKVVTEILQDLEILKRLLKHNANLKIRINYYLTAVDVHSHDLKHFIIHGKGLAATITFVKNLPQVKKSLYEI